MRYFVILVFTLACFFAPMTVSAGETIRLTTGEWPPYFSEDLNHNGIGWRICQEAFAMAGVRITPEFMPWKRALAMAEIGHTFAGTTGWQRTLEREGEFWYSDPILTRQIVFFHTKKGRFDWESLKDIGHMTIGVTLGYSHIEMLEPVVYRQGGRLDMAPTDALNFEKLLEHRIDLFPCALEVGNYILNRKLADKDTSKVRYDPKPLLTGPIHLLISKRLPEGKKLMEQFNRGLQHLHASGRYDRIVSEARNTDFVQSEAEDLFEQ